MATLTDEFDELLEELKPAKPKSAKKPRKRKRAVKMDGAPSNNGKPDPTEARLKEYEWRPRNRRWKMRDGVTLSWQANVFEEATLQVLAFFQHEETGGMFVMPLALWSAGKPIVLPPLNEAHYWTDRPCRGCKWKHYKGIVYIVVDNAVSVPGGDHYIIYKGDHLWARNAQSWFDLVDAHTPRFTPCK